MARGYAYEIMDNKEDVGMFSEEDLYDCFDRLGADYFKNVPEEEQAHLRNSLLDLFRCYGAETDEADFSFVMSEELKKNWFKKQFETVQRLAGEMTLEEFSTDKLWKVLDLQMAIDNTYADTVYDGYCHDSFDEWIRKAENKKKYYIGNVVLMH